MQIRTGPISMSKTEGLFGGTPNRYASRRGELVALLKSRLSFVKHGNGILSILLVLFKLRCFS